MELIQRSKRLWQLSGTPLASAENLQQVLQCLQSQDEKLNKIMEWMGVLLRAELNRYERQQEEPIHVEPARRSLH
jgi:hypothetical protein